jgi:hypothetical protein
MKGYIHRGSFAIKTSATVCFVWSRITKTHSYKSTVQGHHHLHTELLAKAAQAWSSKFGLPGELLASHWGIHSGKQIKTG